MHRIFELLYSYFTDYFWGILVAIISFLATLAGILPFFFKINDYPTLVRIVKPKLHYFLKLIFKPFQFLIQIAIIITKGIINKLVYSQHKWIYRISFFLLIVTFSSYSFYNYYQENKKFKIGIQYHYMLETYGFNKTIQKTIDSVLTKNNILYSCENIKIDDINHGHLTQNKYDIILTSLPYFISIQSAQFNQIKNKNSIIIDVLSHGFKLPFEELPKNYNNLKYRSYENEIIEKLDKIVGNTNPLYLLNNKSYISLLNKPDKKIIKMPFENSFPFIMNNINNYNAIVVDCLFNYKQIVLLDDYCVKNNKALTVYALNYFTIDPKRTQLRKLKFIALVPSKSPDFYASLNKHYASEIDQINIDNFLIGHQLSVILGQVKNNGVYTLDKKDLINKEFNSPIGRIKFNNHLENTNLEPIFFDFKKQQYY